MALADFVYRLKAQQGDSTPHDEKGTAGDLSGGTIALVDLGSSDYAWSFTGKASTTSGPSKTTDVGFGAANGGVTGAIRIAVTTYPVDFATFLGWVDSAASPVGGLVLSGGGVDGYVRCRWLDCDAVVFDCGTTVHTLVWRIVAGGAGLDRLDAWINTVGRGNTDPNSTGPSPGNFSNQTFSQLFAGQTGYVIKVSDWVLWSEELSNADCTALADDGIRATLDAGASAFMPAFAANGLNALFI